MKDLERSNKLLTETINAKNPNYTKLLMEANKQSMDDPEKKDLKDKLAKL